ncbi:site-specific integrase [soil metagenome]
MPVIPNKGDSMATPHLFALFAAGIWSVRSSHRGAGWPRRLGVGACYKAAMTPSIAPPVPDDPPDSPPGVPTEGWQGLTDDDATRIVAAIAATHAEATRTAYAHAGRHWVRWCTGRRVGFPAEPAVVCAYLAERAEQGVCVATLDLACAAIGHQHRHHGLPDPIDHDTVRQVRRGLRRLLGTAPRRPARPLSIDDLRQIITSIDRTTARGVRDTAVILLGFAGALRRSELAALTLADLEAKPAGLLVYLRRSKTDPERRGQVVGIAHGQHALTDPIAALGEWLAVRGTAPGPVFTSLRPGVQGLQPISGSAVSKVVKDRAAAAGLSAERITAHSLRAGHATSAALAGVSIERIAAQTRHRRIDVLIERYIRPAQALQTTSSRDLGL